MRKQKSDNTVDFGTYIRGICVCLVVSRGSPALRKSQTEKHLIRRKKIIHMKQRYLNFKDDEYIYERAVIDCFQRKWKRNDILCFIEKYAGIPRHELFIEELETIEDKDGNGIHGTVKLEAIQSCGLALEEAIQNILNGHIDDVDIEPPRIRQRPDGMTGKTREIALLCVMHQLVEHVTFNLLQPLFDAKLYPTQHASIPGHGQTRLKNQVHKYLRMKNLNIKYFCKTDMKHAYQSMKYTKIIELMKEDIPNAKHIFKLLEFLGELAPDGHLIIGGYLDAWLFNYAMSKVIGYVYSLGQERRGKFTRYAIRIVTFMDDMLILSNSKKGIKIVIAKASKYAKSVLGMTMKLETGIVELLSIEEERAKRDKKGAAHGCPSVDMAGFKICRSHISIRKRVFLRTRRQLLRAYNEIVKYGTISIQRARKIISYNGFIKQSDSQKFIDKYHVNQVMKIARQVVGFHAYISTRKRLEKLYDIRECTIKYKTKLSNNRKSPGWPTESCHC